VTAARPDTRDGPCRRPGSRRAGTARPQEHHQSVTEIISKDFADDFTEIISQGGQSAFTCRAGTARHHIARRPAAMGSWPGRPGPGRRLDPRPDGSDGLVGDSGDISDGLARVAADLSRMTSVMARQI
jgi:hypothetical protein